MTTTWRSTHDEARVDHVIVVVLLVGGAAAVIASTLGSTDSPPTHVMPGGKTMQGQSMQRSPTHTMSDGSSMSGSQMER